MRQTCPTPLTVKGEMYSLPPFAFPDPLLWGNEVKMLLKFFVYGYMGWISFLSCSGWGAWK
jgi:hypothetical protein